MSVLAGLQIDGGARVSVQIVSCGCPQNQVVQFVGSEVESRSVTFVEQGVNLGGGAVFLCVSTASLGQHVCVGGVACQLGFGIWVASQVPNQLDR